MLAGGDSRLTLLPALGGKIASLQMAGREWLWTSDVIAPREADDAMRADDDVSYVLLADSGGYDECFPTVGACTLSAAADTFAGLRLPDHGELWSQRPHTVTTHDGACDVATCVWTGRRMPYTVERAARVHPDGRVELRYAAENHGPTPLPFLWSSHPLLPLTPSTRLCLPAGAELRVDATHGAAVAGAMRGAWPRVTTVHGDVDLSRPAAAGDGYACKLFVALPREPVVVAVEEAGTRLEVAIDGRELTHVGLWINNGGWTPFADGRAYHNLAFEPCIGAPDSLARALDVWDAAAWLAPGEQRSWTLAWRGVAQSPAATGSSDAPSAASQT